jgi:uncharacterized membrane protein YadS
VAQVVGAGYSVSTEVGDVSTITKLFRVAMLVPVVLGLSLLLMRGRAEGEGRLLSRAPLPLFVVAFCVFVAINSAGWAPPMLAEPAIAASRWFLVAAIVALGIKTSLKQLAEVGPIPIAVMLAETAFIALWVLIGVWMLAP